MNLITGDKGQRLPLVPFGRQLEQFAPAAMDPGGSTPKARGRSAKNLRIPKGSSGERVREVRLRLEGRRELPLDAIGHHRLAGHASRSWEVHRS
jgi:hypothetical protein